MNRAADTHGALTTRSARKITRYFARGRRHQARRECSRRVGNTDILSRRDCVTMSERRDCPCYTKGCRFRRPRPLQTAVSNSICHRHSGWSAGRPAGWSTVGLAEFFHFFASPRRRPVERGAHSLRARADTSFRAPSDRRRMMTAAGRLDSFQLRMPASRGQRARPTYQ